MWKNYVIDFRKMFRQRCLSGSTVAVDCNNDKTLLVYQEIHRVFYLICCCFY